ncbi:hypothetical protein BGX38DRAFT_1168736 [Terfezia claveryi]|nr:hypothetical protein BGX38DRAFT_1168736 [Terfezia claveryi]
MLWPSSFMSRVQSPLLYEELDAKRLGEILCTHGSLQHLSGHALCGCVPALASKKPGLPE